MIKLARQLVVVTTLLLSPTLAQAQCTEVSGTGCSGATRPECGGSPQIGQTMKFVCLNQGRSLSQVMFVGGCLAAPLPLAPPLVCGSGTCGLGVDPTAMLTINTGFSTVLIAIPNDPALINLTACFQCLDLTSSGCLSVSPAVSATFTP